MATSSGIRPGALKWLSALPEYSLGTSRCLTESRGSFQMRAITGLYFVSISRFNFRAPTRQGVHHTVSLDLGLARFYSLRRRVRSAFAL